MEVPIRPLFDELGVPESAGDSCQAWAIHLGIGNKPEARQARRHGRDLWHNARAVTDAKLTMQGPKRGKKEAKTLRELGGLGHGKGEWEGRRSGGRAKCTPIKRSSSKVPHRLRCNANASSVGKASLAASAGTAPVAVAQGSRPTARWRFHAPRTTALACHAASAIASALHYLASARHPAAHSPAPPTWRASMSFAACARDSWTSPMVSGCHEAHL